MRLYLLNFSPFSHNLRKVLSFFNTIPLSFIIELREWKKENVGTKWRRQKGDRDGKPHGLGFQREI